MRIDGEDCLTGLSGTTMTHPNYRGRGLFPILAQKVYERMAAHGMKMVWGFPNALSHRGFIKNLGWQDIYQIPNLRLTLSDRMRLPQPENAVIEVDQPDERFDRLWTRVQDNWPLAVRRDRQYLQWRYVDNPTVRYRIFAFIDRTDILGYAVFKRYRTEYQIVDILTLPDPEVGFTACFGNC